MNHTVVIQDYHDTWRACDILVESDMMGFLFKDNRFYNMSDEHLRKLDQEKLKYKILETYDGLDNDEGVSM